MESKKGFGRRFNIFGTKKPKEGPLVKFGLEAEAAQREQDENVSRCQNQCNDTLQCLQSLVERNFEAQRSVSDRWYAWPAYC